MSKESRGFATVGVTLMLMLILAAITLYAGKVLVMEKRISRNELQYAAAFASAESWLESGAQRFFDDSAVCDTTETYDSNSGLPAGHQATLSWECDSGTAPVTITASYLDSASGASATVAEGYAFAPLFALGSPAPLTFASTAKFNGTMDLGANPNGGGTGVPVSIWTGESDDLTGAAESCGYEEFERGSGQCSGDTYSSKKDGMGNDIIVNDPAFPDDLFAFVFGIPTDQWRDIYYRGAQKIDDCGELTASSTGIFVYEGNSCVMQQAQAGSPSAPIILISADGGMDVRNNTKVYGVLFSLDTDLSDSSEPKISIKTKEGILGSVMGNHGTGNTNSNLALSWHPEVFSAYEDDPNKVFSPLVRVAGSWRDFAVE
ncbi:pilus assembly PilX family protein [Ferrimonas marina]|uniref:Type 4 fimbrial biogenesis protein PilX N-terminal domain-containing protein n=1 Tax=Ferrimonas marina TaxID=299255 RepID=A0A1M5VWN1_9GAMM|nr:PilX N-terminal domain-containing pilus assembly protein [Ferrimonas marina]SHH79580.1 hypothetical protein SAMN02745129_3031 [Ferrimonas marina]